MTEETDRIGGRQLGLLLCEALGLDPNATGKIMIEASPMNHVRISVERIATAEDGRHLGFVLKHYQLIEDVTTYGDDEIKKRRVS